MEPILGTETAPPTRIKVAHVLISFAGAGTRATRSKDEAAALAAEIYQQAKSGVDFDQLMKRSDDGGGGKYGMFTDAKAQKPGDYARTGMVPAFGDIGFTLKLGEMGVAPFDPKKSPYGWHIIKRIE
ncbi:MAG TPA: peptidylprolyl isomerase [Planctomycetota bacterium]|nr:peptidylprolyl isomerase [Planctomycetota bacterium]